MKKLMIAAAIVCAAAMTQAASISWKANDMRLTDADGNYITALDKGSLALVVMTSATGWDTAVDVSTLGNVTADTNTIATKTSTKGQVSGTLEFNFNAEGNKIKNDNYLALMYNDGTGKLSQLEYTSGPNDGDPVSAVWQIASVADNSSSVTGAKIGMTGNFGVASVPEPTSAMLLLLGVAGLALRRRRA